jgi:hypothetical protein
MEFPLSIVTAVTIALFIIVGIVQTIQKKVRVGCAGQIYLFIAVITATLSLSFASVEPGTLQISTLITASALAVLILSSAAIFLLERRQEEFKRIMSRGLLGLTTGGILFVIFFAIPMIPQFVLSQPTLTPIAQGLQSGSNLTEASTPSAGSQTVSDEATLSPSITYTAIATETPTRTRRAFVPPSQTPTPEAASVADECDAQITVNLNLRSEPNTDSVILGVIPEGTFVPLEAKNEDGTWWRGTFEGQSGWLFGELIELDPICLVE